MTAMTSSGAATAWTLSDRDALPDDGYRHELIDGTLIVTPAPSRRHQYVSGNLYLRLRAACPADLDVLYAPFDVRLADDTVLQPDLLVARRDDFTDANLPMAPLLAVEIISRSTRLYDLNLKKARYERDGLAVYWVVDPTTGWLKAWQLDETGVLMPSAEVEPGDDFVTEIPFPVTLTARDRHADLPEHPLTQHDR